MNLMPMKVQLNLGQGNKSATNAQPQAKSGTKRQLSLTAIGFSTITNKKHQQDPNIADDKVGGPPTETATDTAINGDHLLTDAVSIPTHALPHHHQSDNEPSVAADQEAGVSVDGLLAEQQERLLSLVVDDGDTTANLENDTIAAAIPEGTFVIDANGWSRVGGQPVKAHAHDVRSILSSKVWLKRTVRYEHRIKDKLLPTNDHAILARHETELIERLNTSFVRSPSNSDYLMHRCDYTGQLLPWTHGPRNASLESICSFASPDGKLGYHVIPNIAVVMNGLNIMKMRHSPTVLPLIPTWLRTLTVADFPTPKSQLVWAYTAVSNGIIMGELLGYFGCRTRFLQFEPCDETTRGGCGCRWLMLVEGRGKKPDGSKEDIL